MAKVTFTKLGLKKNEDIKKVTIGEQEIEVKQYLPIQDKLDLISRVINYSIADNDFENPVQIRAYTDFEILSAYTNISFTEKQQEDFPKTYDLLDGNKVFAEIFAWIPTGEYNLIINGVKDSIKAYYTHRSSALGILESVTQDYDNLNLDATEIQKKLADPQNMEFLKDVLTKLG